MGAHHNPFRPKRTVRKNMAELDGDEQELADDLWNMLHPNATRDQRNNALVAFHQMAQCLKIFNSMDNSAMQNALTQWAERHVNAFSVQGETENWANMVERVGERTDVSW